MRPTTPNTDESTATPDHPFIGNFHKTLPHNDFGEVEPNAYRAFERVCIEIEAGSPRNFESVPKGSSSFPCLDAGSELANTAKFTSPLAGASTESLGPDPRDLEMPPAPGILSTSTAAEMVELYWMALLRDEPIANFGASPLFAQAVTSVGNAFNAALGNDFTTGALRLGLDLPQASGALAITPQTLFRSGLKDEEHGPLISQFFLHDAPYGTQLIDSRQFPYAEGRDYLTHHEDWLRAQNTGKDAFGRDYGSCNHYDDDNGYYDMRQRRHIATLRDLARFVNRDALHQAYFNAALILLAVNAPLDTGNPYNGNRYSREGRFATLGGPDLLSLVSEVASRALKVVWRQKWLVHRRARPEVYGGLLQMELNGFGGSTREYGVAAAFQELAGKCDIRSRIETHNAQQNAARVHRLKAIKGCQGFATDAPGTLFLPMAFSAGSPSHPAYGAGHATVAGACVTVLKAWFDEAAPLCEVFSRANSSSLEPRGAAWNVLGPSPTPNGPNPTPVTYAGGDIRKITVGGELNKVASNVAMGRSMGGVHWRSDNTRSLRLGELIAIEILRKRTAEYAERPVSFEFSSFDRERVRIAAGFVEATR